MADERPPIAVDPNQWRILRAILSTRLPGRAVWAFGSRAQGRAKPYSDLDLAIIGDEALSLATRAELREAFSASDLAWRVDVVDWATTSPAFRAIIERDKVVLQGPGPSG